MPASVNAPVVGLDTSVVLRLLIGEPPGQAATALRFVQDQAAAGTCVVVSDLVVSEVYFALQAHYQVPKPEAVRTLLALLESGLVAPEADGCAPVALRAVLSGSQKLGFVDRLIHAQYAHSGAPLVTFEHAAARLANSVLLRG